MPIKKIFCSAFALALFSTLAPSTGAQDLLPVESPTGFEITVPAGTVIPIVLTAYLNSRSSQAGDVFYADTTYPVWIQQKLAIPKGSTIRGTVVEVVRPGRIKGKAKMAIRFDDILLPNGVKRDLTASFRGMHGGGDESFDKKSESVSASASKGDDVRTVVEDASIGAGLGGVGGVISGSTKAIGIGAGAGAAVGIASVLLGRGKELVLSPGTQFDLELLRPMTFTFSELEFSESQLANARQQIQAIPVQRNDPGSNRGRNFPRIGIPY